MIVSNIYLRVMRIHFGNKQATAFTITLDGRQYLVTAKHVLPPGEGPHIAYLDGQRGLSATVDFAPMPVHSEADVAVTALSAPLTEDMPVTPSMDGLVYGQECYFLGYPFGLGLGGSTSPQLPFVKRCILSAQEQMGWPDRVRTLYLDGHNNIGFSGGPVFFYRDNDRSSPCIAGVVSGYRNERLAISINGNQAVDAHVLSNSGIVIASDIHHVVEAVAAAAGQA